MSTPRKTAANASPVAGLVDCETCRHFTGSVGWASSSWGCAKKHPAEDSFYRRDCADYALASRDERIFRRFKLNAEWYGDESFKSRQTQARRTANSLAKSLAEFGGMMDAEQVAAGKAAVDAMNRLADDLERAARLAKAHKARKDAERDAERLRRGDELAGKVLVDLSDAAVVECAADLSKFQNSAEADRWLDNRRGRRVLMDTTYPGLGSLLANWRQARSDPGRASALAELRRCVAQVLDSMERPVSSEYATRADFDAFRVWQRDKRAATASVAALVANAKASGGESS